jgi:hypothetical protein
VRGRPRPPGRATRTWSTSPTSWVVSASCPGVSRVARLRPRPSQMVCSLVVSPPRDRPSACCRVAWIGEIPLFWRRRRAGGLPGSRRSPFAGPGGVLVSADDAGVDLGVPVQLAGRVGLGVQGGLDPGPGPVGLPAGEPLVDRLPGTIALGQVPPRHSGPDPEQDAVEDLAMITPAPTPFRLGRGQQRRQPLPLLVGELKSSVHARLLPHPLPSTQTHPPIRETRPRWLVSFAGVSARGVVVYG